MKMVTEKRRQYNRQYSRIRRQREWFRKNVTHETLRKFLKDIGAGSQRGSREELIDKIMMELEKLK